MIEECSPSGGAQKRGRVGMELASNIGATTQTEERQWELGSLPSQAEEHRNKGILCRMKSRSAKSRKRGLWSANPSRGAPKKEELTAEGCRRE